MALRQLLWVVAVLGLVSVATANFECESSSVMFGSPWNPTNSMYIQESSWKTHGNITKVNVYADAELGCLLGLKATYGWQAGNARRLGVEKSGEAALPSLDIKLSNDEYFNKAQYKFGRCITYFMLETNTGRQLEVGDIHSSGPLQTSQPEWQDGFLAYFKAYTDEPNSSASMGKLEQLQLVWTSKSCSGEQGQQLAEAILGEARDPAVQRMSAQAQAPAAVTAAAEQPDAADMQDESPVEDVTRANATGAVPADPAGAAAATQPAGQPAQSAAAGPEVTAVQGAGGAATADAAEGDADNEVMDDADAAAGAGAAASEAQAAALDAAAATAAPAAAAADPAEVPATPEVVAAVVTTTEVEETPADDPAAAAVQPAAATTAATATAAPTPASTAAAKPAKAGKIKTLFVGPHLKSPADAASSSTVINTTTIITSTTTDKKPTPDATTYTTSTLTSATTTTTAVCNPGGNCADGLCATSSCMLNGMGKDVATMMCFGTNLMPNPLLEAMTGNPCTNLACKLDKSNCTTTNFGLDGFCTGKVVAMGSNAKLHASGKTFLGYPCIEHRGPVLDLVPLGDYTARGVYMAKAWKVCDCISGLGLKDGSISIELPLGASLTIIPPKFPTLPQYPWINRTLINMSLPDVLAQWVAANLADAPMPTATIDALAKAKLQSLLPNFTLPSLVLPKISAPLMKLPANFSLPVFMIPIGNRTLQRVLSLVPGLTALPTLMTPSLPQVNISVTTSQQQLTLPEVTVTNLGDLADSFGVPHMPRMPSLSNMSFTDAITQWVVAKQFSMPVATVRLAEAKLRSIQDLVPDFRVPALLVPNISLPLLRLPSNFPIHVAAIPNDNKIIKALESIFPGGKLTSLPAFVTANMMPLGTPRLPLLSLRNITIPTIEEIAIEVGAAPPKWFTFDLEKMAQQLSNMTWKIPSLPAPLQYTLPSMNFTLPSITLPDITLPQLPQLPNLPGMPKPNLTRITEAVSSMPDFAADIGQWPKLLDQWKAKHLSQPFDFDLSAVTKLVTKNEQTAGDGMDISFEVPNVMAQWIAGIIQKVPLPQLEVQDETQLALKSLLPQLLHLPALVVMNTSTPYLNAAASEMKDMPTVVVPDNKVAQVTSLLPKLTFVPSLLVPSSSISSDGEGPSISITLPRVTLDQIATPNFIKTVQNMLSNVKGRSGSSEQVSVSLAPAAAAPARDAASTTTNVMNNNADTSDADTSDAAATPAAAPVDASTSTAPAAAAVEVTDAADANVSGDTTTAPATTPYVTVPAAPAAHPAAAATLQPAAAAAVQPAAAASDQPAAAGTVQPAAPVTVQPAAAAAQPAAAATAQPAAPVTVQPAAAPAQPAAAATAQPAAPVANATAASPSGEPVVTEEPPGAALGTAPAAAGSQEVTAGTNKPESAHVADAAEFVMNADGEGSSVVPEGLAAGPSTAFMDPKDWAKLDKATQQEFLAIFNP